MKKVILFLFSTSVCCSGHHKRQLTEYFTLNRMFDVAALISNSTQDVGGSDLESDGDDNSYSLSEKPKSNSFAAIQKEIATEYTKRPTDEAKKQYLDSIASLTKAFPEMLDQINN